VADYQFSLVHKISNVGRMEYRSFSDDDAALKFAGELVGDFDKVTVLQEARIVGVVWHPRLRPRA
jgi:hypothetical protein